MTIKPKFTKKYPTGFPVGAIITLNEKDIMEFSAILSYAVRSESCGKMLYQLAAVCESVNVDADVGLSRATGEDKKADAAYAKVRKLFDPGYGGSE